MRVSDKQRYHLSQTRIGKFRSQQLDLSAQLSSGVRLNRPSEDPLASKKVLALRSENRRVEQYSRSLDAAEHLLHTADQALGESTNALFRAKEIGLRSINGANTANDLRFLGDELNSIRDFVRNLANTRTNNRYIFGGFISQTPPYDNANTFVGDTNVTRYEVGDGELIDATITGGAAFGDGTPEP